MSICRYLDSVADAPSLFGQTPTEQALVGAEATAEGAGAARCALRGAAASVGTAGAGAGAVARGALARPGSGEAATGASMIGADCAVGVGAKHMIYNLCEVLLDEGDGIAFPTPYWTSYVDIAEIVNAKIKFREAFRPFAPSVLWFAVFRLIAGMGLGAVLPTALTYVGEYSGAGSTARATTLTMTGYHTGAVLAALL